MLENGQPAAKEGPAEVTRLTFARRAQLPLSCLSLRALYTSNVGA